VWKCEDLSGLIKAGLNPFGKVEGTPSSENESYGYNINPVLLTEYYLSQLGRRYYEFSKHHAARAVIYAIKIWK